MGARRWVAVLLVTLLPMAAGAGTLHCSGATSAGYAEPEGGASEGGAPGGDSAAADSACTFGFCDELPPVGPFAPCAATPPEAGTPCTTEGERCEYGGSVVVACDLVMACSAGVWHTASTGPCTGPALLGDAGCPPSWLAATTLDGGPCPALDCQYPEGYCSCEGSCGSGGQSPGPHPLVSPPWSCKASVPGCPSPRPPIGTACDTDAGCEYGWSCGCGTLQACTQGVWQGVATPGCP
jgi:hypothetical protein